MKSKVYYQFYDRRIGNKLMVCGILIILLDYIKDY